MDVAKFSAIKASTSVLPFTEKSKFITLVGFTVICSYRISLGIVKDEGLKELCCDLSSKKANFFESVRHKLLYFPCR